MVEVNYGEPLKIIDTIEFDDSKEYDYDFFYKGGGKSLAGGTLGIGGVSPFFIKLSSLKKIAKDETKSLGEKIKHSSDFIGFYKKEYKDNLLEDFFEDIKEREEEIANTESDWLFIKKVQGKGTLERHCFFIKEYLLAPQNKNINWVNGYCSFCGSEGEMRDIRLPFFSLDISNYNFGMASNDIDKGPLKLCSDCELDITGGWNYISSVFGGYYVLIPEPCKSNRQVLNLFFRLANENASNFEKLNNVMREKELHKDLEFKFLVTSTQQSKVNILKMVPHYKMFAVEFQDELLVDGNYLQYFPAGDVKISVSKLENFFELEKILKSFFVNDNNYPLFDNFHFYQLYNRDLPKNMDNLFKHLLYTHRDEMFSFIYECNLDGLKKSTLLQIVANFLQYEMRKCDTDERFGGGIVRNKIIEGLNYYYFLCSKIYGESNMKKEFEELKKNFEKFDQAENRERIKQIAGEKNPEMLYYLIGQFIRKIDDFRYIENKNKIFNGFVESLNKKNVTKRFAEDIIQGQNYYIERLNPKVKFIFDVLAENTNNLFKDTIFPEVLISMTSGYYSENILKSEKEGENNE